MTSEIVEISIDWCRIAAMRRERGLFGQDLLSGQSRGTWNLLPRLDLG